MTVEYVRLSPAVHTNAEVCKHFTRGVGISNDSENGVLGHDSAL